MKKNLLIAFSFISIFTFAQTSDSLSTSHKKQFDLWVNLGAGMWNTSKQSNLLNFNSGLNAVIAEKHYVAFQYNTGFSKGFLFAPNKIFLQHLEYVRYGQRMQIRKCISFTPSIGIGMAYYAITRFYADDANAVTSFFGGLLNNSFGKTIYASYTDKSICIPINLDFDFTGRFAGVGIGLNMIVMKYPSIGLTGNILLGKIWGKKKN